MKSCFQGAISNKFSSRNAGPTPHWLDHYMDDHVCESDPKCLALKNNKKGPKCHKVTTINYNLNFISFENG